MTVLFQENQREGVLILNRPEILNALNCEMIAHLTKVFKDIKERKDLRILTIKGEGRSFCAGADVNYMRECAKFSHEENLADAQKLQNLFFALDQIHCPTITYVHRHAMGGALGLMAASDYVIAHPDTVFSFSEVRLGLIPGVIAPFVLKKIGESYARAYFLSGERFGVDEAMRMGLIHEVGTEEILEERKKSFTLAAPGAARAAKELIVKCRQTDAHQSAREAIAYQRCTPEAQKGMQALLEKKKVNWDNDDVKTN